MACPFVLHWSLTGTVPPRSTGSNASAFIIVLILMICIVPVGRSVSIENEFIRGVIVVEASGRWQLGIGLLIFLLDPHWRVHWMLSCISCTRKILPIDIDMGLLMVRRAARSGTRISWLRRQRRQSLLLSCPDVVIQWRMCLPCRSCIMRWRRH